MNPDPERHFSQDKEAKEIKEIIIPKEDAVFWLDSRGYWRNAGGRFRKKKIVDHFHAAISRDQNGYFLYQQKDEGIYEKVYFPYEDTALFVFDVIFETSDPAPEITLVLNTGRKLSLNPRQLYTQSDGLYLKEGEETIKFTERALMKLSNILDEKAGQFYIHAGGRAHPVPEY
ncbi:MAG: MFS transporter permease [Desulfobacterales bacterium]